MTGQSESEPMTIPTRGPDLSASLTLVSQLSGEPRRGMPGALQTLLQVVTVGVDVPDLAPRPRLLAVQVHPQVRVAGQGVGVPVVQPAAGVGGAAEDVDHHR